MIKQTVYVGALTLFLAVQANAGPAAGDKTLALSGSGGSDKKFDSNSFGGNAELGWFTSDALQVGLRQSLNVSNQRDVGLGSDSGKTSTVWNAATRGFADYHFGSGPFLPFLGLNVGALYGDHVDNTGTLGAELGFKAYVKDKTYITFQAEYDYLINSNNDIQSNFDDGAVFYTLGIGYNF